MFSSRVGFYKQPTVASQTIVAVGDGGNVWSSTNGTTWTNRRTQSGHVYRDVTRAHNLWIIAGQTSGPTPLIITSSDLSSYTTRSNPTGSWSGYENRGITTSGSDTNIVVQLDSGSNVYYDWGSSDGINWTANATPFGYNNGYSAGARPKPTYFDSNFVMSGARSNPPPNYSATYYTSTTSTGTTTPVNISNTQDNYAVFVEKVATSLYVAWVGGTSAGFYRSTNGTSWSAASTSVTSRMNAAASDGTTIVSVGVNGLIYTSTNGNTWTSRTSGIVFDINDVIWTGNQFIAVAYNAILTSSNGTSWTNQYSGSAIEFLGIAVG